MNEISGNEKENEVTPAANSEEAKKVPDLMDAISRLRKRKVDDDAEEGEEPAE